MTACKIIAAFLLLNVLGTGPVLGQVSCPDDFSVIDDKCFQFVLDKLNWAEAQANCEALGGYLAILDECRLWADVVKNINAQGMTSSHFWIGATDLAEEGVWLWLNGKNVEMGIPFWGWTETYPEPQGGTTTNCANLNAGDRYYFHDNHCNIQLGSVCQVAPTLLMPTEEYLQE